MAVKKLEERAALLRAVRSFFYGQDYLEVETPIRQPVLLPEAEIIAVASENWYLQSSPEQAMKRLLARGHDRIFQICKCFRAQERGRRHLPEFTMLEWYRLHADYFSLMAETEEMVADVASSLAGRAGFSEKLCRQLASCQWRYLTVADAFQQYADMSATEAVERGSFDEILVSRVEPRLGVDGPCFLHDYPARLGSLARLKEDDPSVAERFELYIGGVELANGFSELTDAREQRRRFAAELAEMAAAGPLPEKFLAELDHIPAACGIALGIDRLLMVLTGAEEIDSVVAFTPEEL